MLSFRCCCFPADSAEGHRVDYCCWLAYQSWAIIAIFSMPDARSFHIAAIRWSSTYCCFAAVVTSAATLISSILTPKKVAAAGHYYCCWPLLLPDIFFIAMLFCCFAAVVRCCLLIPSDAEQTKSEIRCHYADTLVIDIIAEYSPFADIITPYRCLLLPGFTLTAAYKAELHIAVPPLAACPGCLHATRHTCQPATTERHGGSPQGTGQPATFAALPHTLELHGGCCWLLIRASCWYMPWLLLLNSSMPLPLTFSLPLADIQAIREKRCCLELSCHVAWRSN